MPNSLGLVLAVAVSGLIASSPLAFLASLEIAYALVPAACSSGNTLPIHLVHFASLIIVCVAGVVAWRSRNQVGREWPAEEGGPIARSRFMREPPCSRADSSC